MVEFLTKPLPFDEAISYFENKVPMGSGRYTDIWHQQHSHVFTFARSAGFDFVADVQNALTQALQEGTDFRVFKKQVLPMLEKKGWFKHVGAKTDKAKSRRLKVIYRTNMRTTYAAAQWQQGIDTEMATGEPIFVEYIARMDGKTRPEHRQWDGIILPMNDGFWDYHLPPNGWGCRCTSVQHTKTGLDAEGLTPTNSSPPRDTTIQDIPGRGKTTVTKGIDPAFDYHIGKGYDKNLRAFEGRKWDSAEQWVQNAMLSAILSSKNFKRLTSKGTSNYDYVPIGYAGTELQKPMQAKTGLLLMSGQTALKQRLRHPDLDIQDYAIVQKIIEQGMIKTDIRPNHYVGFIEINGKWWRAAWKIVEDEIWFLSLTKTKASRIKLKNSEKWIRE